MTKHDKEELKHKKHEIAKKMHKNHPGGVIEDQEGHRLKHDKGLNARFEYMLQTGGKAGRVTTSRRGKKGIEFLK